MSLLDILKDRPEDILLPNASVQKDALQGLKQALDTVAKKYTPLDSIHVDGLKADQVWVQAQMILEGVTTKLNNEVERLGGTNGEPESESEEGEDDDLVEDDSEDLEEGQDPEELSLSDEDNAELDLENMHDDYEESDQELEEDEPKMEDSKNEAEEEEEEDDSDNESTGAEPTADSSESKPIGEDNFDLAEFQQHVLNLEKDDDDDDEEDDQNVDYFAEVDDSSEDADMHYEDFFGPAPKRAKKEQKKKVKFAADDDAADEGDEGEESAMGDNAELDSVMENTRKDLFDDDEDDMDDAEAGPSGAKNLSNFERQQLEISQQIEELESENVGEKDWGMRGEAQAKDRPEDSLYNIQFERNAKPAPVITVESTASIEDLIKERIRKEQFDDIPRRSELAALNNAKKELPDLSDAKSQKSLAELYEEDHMRQENPDYYSKQDSAALDAAHREVVDLFTNVTRRLDALCSWQYTPRPAAPSLTVLSDTQSISMEEAQPGTMAPEAQLAPQEVYKGDSVVPMANQEMSTSLKRKKRRDKAMAKASKSASTGKPSDAKRNSKEEMFSTLKRGNVTMLDKRGNKRDMRGEEVKDKAPTTSTQVKL